MKRLVAALTILFFSGWAGASAQSLAELAKKEKERRKKVEGTRSFNDRDLAAWGSGLPASMAQQDSESEDVVSSEEEEAEDDDPTQTAAYWRERLSNVDRRIADIESQLNRPGFDQDPSNLRRRNRLERDLEQARAERQAILEEGRHAGVPPGWLR
jgi:hypothetical protein